MSSRVNSRFGPSIYLAEDGPQVIAQVQESDEEFFSGPRLPRDIVIALGGSGIKMLVYLLERLAREGRSVAYLAVDNHFGERLKTRLLSPTGQLIGIHRHAFVPLGHRHARTEVRNHPVLSKRYEGSEGLLRGISVREQFVTPQFGGHALRPLSQIDYDLYAGMLARRFRRLFRQFVRQAQAEEDNWTLDRPPVRREDEADQIRIWVLFSGVGSCGAAGSYLVPFMLQREAERVGLDVVVYGVCTGPTVYTGLHDHVLENYAATLEDLEEASSYGIQWTLGDGSRLEAALPGLWRIFLFDDEEALERIEEIESLDGERVHGVPEPVRQQFFANVAKALFLAMTTTAMEHVEGDAGNSQRLPWSVMGAALGDASRQALEELVPLEIAARRLERIAGSSG